MTYHPPKTASSNNNLPLTYALMPWLVWGLSCLFYFYENLLQVSPSVMSMELMRDFQISSQTLGMLSGIFFYFYAPMQLPAGLLMDYFGPRRLLTFAAVTCSIGALLFGGTDNFFVACVARALIGIGSAFAAVGTMKFAVNWFPPERFALLTGLMVTIGMLGAIGGEAPLALMVDHYGWNYSLLVMGGVGGILAFFLFTMAKDSPATVAHRPLSNHPKEAILKNLATLVKNKQLWLVAVYGGLMYMSTPVLCGLWGVPFLMLKMGVDKVTAAGYITLVLVGWAIASPLWGIFSNRIGLRKPPMYIGSVGALISSVLFIYAPIESSWMMQFLLFSFGIFSAGFLPAFSVANELCNKHHVATGLGFMNMMNMVGIAFAQPAVGFILDRVWQGEVINQVRIYSLDDYHVALALLPAGILIALLSLFGLRETYCKNTLDN